jgi:hypothetical protein
MVIDAAKARSWRHKLELCALYVIDGVRAAAPGVYPVLPLRERVHGVARHFLLFPHFTRLVASDASIVWIASVSKSGNTWLRFMLHEALFGETTSGREPDETVPHWLHLPRLEKEGQLRRTPRGGHLVAKVHQKHDQTAKPTLRSYLRLTAGAIYVVRNPQDVLLAKIHHMRLTGMRDDESDEQLAEAFLAGRLFPGEPWTEHVEGWGSAPFPVLTVRYEDLKGRGPSELERILDFLGEPAESSSIQQIVERCSLAALQKLEDRTGDAFGYRPRGGRTDIRFVNKGLSGQSIAHFGSAFVAAFLRECGATMRRFDYLPTAPAATCA